MSKQLRMNIFDFFKEEEERLMDGLKGYLKSLGAITVEKSFDKIAHLTDGMRAHLEMEEELLVKNSSKTDNLGELIQESTKDKTKVLDEIGRLGQVHIDEPDMAKATGDLIRAWREHCDFTERFFSTLKQMMPEEQVSKINKKLEDQVFDSIHSGEMQKYLTDENEMRKHSA